MITDPGFVTRKALDRFRANRRPFLFKDRTGHVLRLQCDVGHHEPYSVHNTTTRRVFVFRTLPELQQHLRSTA